MTQSGRGIFRPGGNAAGQYTVTYSAVPADHNGGFHPAVTISRHGEEETMISQEVITGWLPALAAAKRLAARVEAYGQPTQN